MVLALCLLGVPGEARAEEDTAVSLSSPEWAQIAPGIEFARVKAQRFCRGGSRGVAVVRVDPGRCRIEPFHEDEYPEAAPATIEAWQIRLGVPVVFNAGLYDEKRRHLGVFRRGGENLPGQPHNEWKGILVSGSTGRDLPPATLLDLSREADRELVPRYPNAVQSMMLFDQEGITRVRRSDKQAPRTVVAVEATGRILVLVTEGNYTLWETSALLMESGWRLTQAMALDGGRAANLAVESEEVDYRSGDEAYGHKTEQLMRASTSLPGVIAVWPDPVD